jgi:hypothetical protein
MVKTIYKRLRLVLHSFLCRYACWQAVAKGSRIQQQWKIWWRRCLNINVAIFLERNTEQYTYFCSVWDSHSSLVWDITPCSQLKINRRFVRTYRGVNRARNHPWSSQQAMLDVYYILVSVLAYSFQNSKSKQAIHENWTRTTRKMYSLARKCPNWKSVQYVRLCLPLFLRSTCFCKAVLFF